jgi:hypothetical protein
LYVAQVILRLRSGCHAERLPAEQLWQAGSRSMTIST